MTWLLLLVWTAESAAVGWPLARSAMPKEIRAFVLLTYGVVGGYALLAVLLIALWGAMPLGPALFWALTIGAIAALFLFWRIPSARSIARLSRGVSRVDALLVATLAAVFAFLAYRFFTVGYSSWDAEALYWHSGLVGWIGRTSFPPSSPLEPNDPLRYRFGLHALAAAVASDSRDSPPAVLAASLAFLMPMMVLAFTGSSVRLFASPRPGLVASILGLFGGSLLPLVRVAQMATGLPRAQWRPQEFVSGLLWLGNNLDMLHNNPTIPAGFVVFSIALWLGWEAVSREEVTAAGIVLGWAAVTYLGLVNEVHYVALISGLGAVAAFRSLRLRRTHRSRWWSPIILVFALVAASYLAISARGGILGGASMTSKGPGSVELVLNTQHVGEVPTPPGVWTPSFVPFLSPDVQIDTDFVLVGLPVLLLMAWRSRNDFARVGLIASGAALIAWFTVYPQRSPYDGFRFGQAGLVAYLSMAPFVISAARKSWPVLSSKAVRWIEGLLLGALISSHLALAVWMTASPPPSWISVPGSPDYAAAEWLRDTQITKRVLVPLPSPQDDFMELYRSDDFGAAMRTIVGDGGHAVPIGHGQYFDPGPYLDHYRRASVSFDAADLAALDIDWVYVLPHYLSEEQERNLQAAEARGELIPDRSFGQPGTPSERTLLRVQHQTP